MNSIAQALTDLKMSLCNSIDVAALISRNNTVHRWKAPWRSLLLREAVAWRTQDLLEQSHMLQTNGSLLGARILLRSAFETTALLIYLNQSIRNVLAEKTDFHEFSLRTTKLLLGSRDKSTSFEAINIVGIFKKVESRYPGSEELYAALSESAHPNHEGLLRGYSVNDPKQHITTFGNQWADMYSNSHDQMILLCLGVLEHEYNDEFISALEALEAWIEKNNAKLEATKGAETEN